MILIERLSPQLYRFFAARASSRIEARDMLQETWLRIHRVRHTYRQGAPLLPWIYAIARCVCVDSYRRRRRIESHEIGGDENPVGANAGGGASQRNGPGLQ
jgi:RNA polymerase sigma-70 factor (ECF subfamily)